MQIKRALSALIFIGGKSCNPWSSLWVVEPWLIVGARERASERASVLATFANGTRSKWPSSSKQHSTKRVKCMKCMYYHVKVHLCVVCPGRVEPRIPHRLTTLTRLSYFYRSRTALKRALTRQHASSLTLA